MSRAKNQANAASGGGGGGGASGMKERSGNLTIVCSICRTSFMSAQTRSQLMTHVESKHSKDGYDKCFPDLKDKL